MHTATLSVNTAEASHRRGTRLTPSTPASLRADERGIDEVLSEEPRLEFASSDSLPWSLLPCSGQLRVWDVVLRAARA